MVDWYSANKLLSHNGIFNFAVGQRGNGKTFDFKKRGINNAINRGEEFIYLRRFTKEMNAAKPGFFSDISHLFPDYDFRINGSKGEMTKAINQDDYETESDFNKAKKARKWVVIVHFIVLITAQNQQSTSYPNVTLIVFDEFIIHKGALQYLNNEEFAFKNFYITVDRYREMRGLKPVRVGFIANSVSIMNPYFIAYDIIPEPGKEFVKRENGFIVVQFIDSESFSKDIYETRLGKFIQDSEYAEFAVSNQFADNDDNLVMVKGYKARYKFTLETANGRFSVWYEKIHNRYHVQEKDTKDPTIYTLLPEKMDENKTLIERNNKLLQGLRSAFNTGRVYFDKPATRNTFREIFKR